MVLVVDGSVCYQLIVIDCDFGDSAELILMMIITMTDKVNDNHDGNDNDDT